MGRGEWVHRSPRRPLTGAEKAWDPALGKAAFTTLGGVFSAEVEEGGDMFI